jgi:hypothetical protein
MMTFFFASGPAAAANYLKAGALRLYPAVTVVETYDNNLFLNSEDEESDWITRVRPELRLSLPMQDFLFQLRGWVEAIRYLENDDQDSTDTEISGSLEANFPGGLGFKVEDVYTMGWLVASQEFGEGEDYDLNEFNARISYDIRDAFRVALRWYNFQFDYDISNDRDRAENIVGASLFYRFLPKTSALVEADYADFSYDTNESLDNTALQFAAGLTWRLTGKSTGEIKAGFQWKDYQDSAEEDGEFGVVSAKLRHFFSGRTSAVLEARRASIETSYLDNPYFVRTGVRGSVDHRFTSKIYGQGFLEYDLDAYPNETPKLAGGVGERDDNTISTGASVGFDILKWLNLELRVAHEKRTSSFDEFEYSVQQVAFLARVGYSTSWTKRRMRY